MSYSLSVISPLLKCCNILAIIRPYEFDTKLTKQRPTSKFYSIYALLVLFSIITSFVYMSHGKFVYLIKEYDLAVIIIDTIANVTLTFNNSASIIIVIFQNDCNFRKLLNEIVNVDKYIKVTRSNGKTKFWCGMIVFQLGQMSIFVVDAVVWLSALTWKWFRYYLPRNLAYYRFSTMLYLIYVMADQIQLRFHLLNMKLEQIVLEMGDNWSLHSYLNTDFKIKRLKYFTYDDLASVRLNYSRLCDIVDSFNAIFGVTLLSSVLFIIIILIQYIVLFILYSLSANNLDGVNFGVNLIILSIVWIAIIMIQAFILAKSCDSLASEANFTSKLCYSLLNRIPIIPRTENHRIIKEELLLLAQQVNCRRVCIKASGFFSINLPLVGFIAASITSYIIVTVQFIDL